MLRQRADRVALVSRPGQRQHAGGLRLRQRPGHGDQGNLGPGRPARYRRSAGVALASLGSVSGLALSPGALSFGALSFGALSFGALAWPRSLGARPAGPLPGWVPACSSGVRPSASVTPASRSSRAGRPRDPALVTALGRDEPVAHVADGPDQGLVLGAELGPQAAHVHVHRAGTAEVVVTPDLLEQMGPGEHPPWMLGEELQQLELLERQIEGPGSQPGRVGGLVDSQVPGTDLVRGGRGQAGLAADGQPQPGLHLGRAGGVQNHIVGAPFGGHRGQSALGDHGQQRGVQARRAQQQAQAPGLGQVTPGVDQDGVRGRGVRQRGDLRGRNTYRVQQQSQGRKDFGSRFQGPGEQQQVTHGAATSAL